MTGLAGVLATQVGRELGDYPGPFVVKCWCGEDGMAHRYPGDAWDAHRAHVAAAVTAWLAERLASEGVRGAVAQSIIDADNEALRRTNFESLCATYDEQATAALAAVVGALAGES